MSVQTFVALAFVVALPQCKHHSTPKASGPWSHPPREQVGAVSPPELGGPNGPKTIDEATERARAEQAWQRRDERAALEEALNAYERLSTLMPNDAAIATRLSRGYFLYGSTQLTGAKERSTRRQAYVRGMLFGEQALTLLSPALSGRLKDGESIESHLDLLERDALPAMLWYTANLGSFVKVNGMATLLFYRQRLEGMIERMVALDEAFCFATPRLMRALWLAKAPSFVGGNLDNSRVEFERALELAPHYIPNAYAFALHYAVPKHDRPLFERLLGPLIDRPVDILPEVAPEARLQLPDAKALLAKRDQLF